MFTHSAASLCTAARHRRERTHAHRCRKIIAILTIFFCVCILFSSCDDGDHSAEQTHWDPAAIPQTRQCAACHRREYEQWVGSDHARAARTPSFKLDAQAFRNQKYCHHGSSFSYTSANNKLLIQDTALDRHPVPVLLAIGREPLVQYAVSGRHGGLQVLSTAWDTTEHEWFDVFADDARLRAEGTAERHAGDWGHYTGRGMTWNSQCAACHVTGFRKNYDPEADYYRSEETEMGVTCLACHPASAHPDALDGCTAQRSRRKLTDRQKSDVCASCHARADAFDDRFRPGDRFEDHYRLELPLAPGVFYANGMQHDEVFTETGYRLSRMGAAGVTCLDCHDPHTGETLLPWEDNSLCLRCHAAGETVNGKKAPLSTGAPAGTCPRDSIGGRCVECHMPESKYMARDPRRDHSLNIPDPALSLELGTPNSCTMCHKDKDAQWAADVLQRAIPKQITEERRPRTRAIFHAVRGQADAGELLRVLERETSPAWRATLLELLARCPLSPAIQQAAARAASDADPSVRAAAADIPGSHVPVLLNDPVRAVRHAAAWCTLEQQQPVSPAALSEIYDAAVFRADQPSGAMQLAALALAAGNTQEAENQYRRAIHLDPSSPVPYMDYAVFLARLHRPTDALRQMLACTRAVPENAEAQFRLALILIELRYYQAAMTALERALLLDPRHTAALQTRAALSELMQYHPSNP